MLSKTLLLQKLLLEELYKKRSTLTRTIHSLEAQVLLDEHFEERASAIGQMATPPIPPAAAVASGQHASPRPATTLTRQATCPRPSATTPRPSTKTPPPYEQPKEPSPLVDPKIERCSRCRHIGHSSSVCRFQHRCFSCGYYGHHVSVCGKSRFSPYARRA